MNFSDIFPPIFFDVPHQSKPVNAYTVRWKIRRKIWLVAFVLRI